MRSTKALVCSVAAAVSLPLLAGCSSAGSEGSQSQIPRIVSEGSRAQVYTSLDQLAAKSNAIIIGKPTGTEFVRPMPAKSAAPDAAGTPYVRIKVVKVLAGQVSGREIDVVSPGTDQHTGKAATARGGPYVMFLAPAMYQKDSPAGGYAIVGGPAGLYATTDSASQDYTRVDQESPALPARLNVTSKLPSITKTEAQLLAEGP